MENLLAFRPAQEKFAVIGDLEPEDFGPFTGKETKGRIPITERKQFLKLE
jgi:hypothetical protein